MTGLMTRSGNCRTRRSGMDRLFDNFYTMRPARTENSAVWAPSVDVSEDSTNFYLRAELPGISREAIDLEVEENVLSIRGERRFEKKEDGENFHFVERSYGSFYRSFTLPRNVDSENIGAEYRDGVLSVMIPKVEEARPKKVEVRT